MNVYETWVFFVKLWNRIILEIWKIIHICRKMSMCKFPFGIMKITNSMVNHIDLYKDCPFKIPILWFPISIVLTSIGIRSIPAQIHLAVILTIFDFFLHVICYPYNIKNTVHEVLDFLKKFLGSISPKISQKTENATVGRYRFGWNFDSELLRSWMNWSYLWRMVLFWFIPCIPMFTNGRLVIFFHDFNLREDTAVFIITFIETQPTLSFTFVVKLITTDVMLPRE